MSTDKERRPVLYDKPPMSHKLGNVRARVEQPRIRIEGGSSNADTVHAVGSPSLRDDELVCESPLCDVRFPQTGLKVSPKRFCSDECKQKASIIKRAGKLLEGVSDQRALEILRRKP